VEITVRSPTREPRGGLLGTRSGVPTVIGGWYECVTGIGITTGTGTA
jgi:hypothetical protein